MIVITGAAGFIGSCMAAHLLEAGKGPLVLVDDFSRTDKLPNLANKTTCQRIERSVFFEWLSGQESSIRAVVHLGARTDTAEQDWAIFEKWNLRYSQRLWQWCSRASVPMLYASSAATYGDGSLGFGDDPKLIPDLQPLNPYGQSKQLFDSWVLSQTDKPPFWAGWKFFNVYGPNEWHKGRMASVIYHAFHQITRTGKLRLFRSHRPEVADGHQARDFVYVKDVVKVLATWLDSPGTSGIYNLGSGQARTFLDLARGLFHSLGMHEQIEFIDTPADIRDTYQYFTQADMSRLKEGMPEYQPLRLEEGIDAYVREYLQPQTIW
ncbi:MAG: ADP-glyceromanno-heptose 6-epimerase [Bacteroidota bacterium]